MEFELQPTLIGETLTVRPLQADEFDILFAAASDPLIWEQHPEPTRYTEPVFRKFFDGGIASGGAFLVLETLTGRVVGSSRYANAVPENSEIEVGYTFIARDYWGGPTNRELKRLMLDHAFQFVERVVFRIGINNQRSRKAVEKLGAMHESTNEESTGVLYALTREQWQRQPR